MLGAFYVEEAHETRMIARNASGEAFTFVGLIVDLSKEDTWSLE